MKKRPGSILAAAVSVLLLIIIDRYTKYLAVAMLKDAPAVPLIRGVLELKYLENHGAAFGMLQNKQGLFFVLTLAVIAAVVFLFLCRLPETRKYLPLNILCVLLLAGAIGNFIDRVTQQYVVDFIYFSLIDFPIFNVADCYVTVSAVLLAVLVLFYYKDEDLKGIL